MICLDVLILTQRVNLLYSMSLSSYTKLWYDISSYWPLVRYFSLLFFRFYSFSVFESSSPYLFYMHDIFFLSLISPFVFHGRKYVVWVCNTMRVSKRWQNFQFFCELVLRLLVDTCHPTCTQIYAHVSYACIICFSVSFPLSLASSFSDTLQNSSSFS